ncbi:hypothetical protein KJ742_07040 [Patescibacteria group bacterium]|nr:hypothetical protein [Patescibacteria group bacterium]MBU1935638.1 hypothetical protein [Patescibacteria group bacterium]
MSIDAIKYVVERGLNDARSLFGDYYEADELEEYWYEKEEADPDFCDCVDDLADRMEVPEYTRTAPFVRPEDIIQRTRKAISVIEAIEKIRSRKIKANPYDPKAVVEAANLKDIGELRDIIAALFVVPNSSYEQLLECCGLEPETTETSKPIDRHNISDVLCFSIQDRRLPTDEEAEELMDCNTNELKAHVQKVLIDDLGEIIERFLAGGWDINHAILNRYSFYYREYGIAAYNLWFDGDFDELCNHPHPQISAKLIQIFHISAHQNRIELDTPWCYVPEGMSDEFADMGWDNVIEAVESHFGVEFSQGRARNNFNIDSATRLMDFWAEHDIPVKPNLLWFAYTPESLDSHLGRLEKLCEIADDLRLPFKTKAQLLRSRMTSEDLYERIAFFERYGLSSEYYNAYLLTPANLLDDVASHIMGAVCAERRLPYSQNLKPRTKLRKTTAKTSHDRVEALLYLDRIGHPYESFQRYTELSPEAYAKRIKMFKEAEVPEKYIYGNIGNIAIEELQRRIPIYKGGRVRKFNQIDYREGDYERMLEERGLDPPDYIKNDKGRQFAPVTIVQKIRFIEERGLPFTGDNIRRKIVFWSWINLGAGPLERKIYDQWAKLHKTEKWEEIGHTYGVDVQNLPVAVRRKHPDNMWRYLRLLKRADINFSSLRPSVPNEFSIPRFRDYLYHDVLNEMDENELTDKQVLFMERYEAAEQAEDDLGWDDPYPLFDNMPPGELQNAREIMSEGGEAAFEYLAGLSDQFKKREEVRIKLLQSKAKYAEIDLLMDTLPVSELEVKIALFEKAQTPVFAPILMEDEVDIQEYIETGEY